MAAIQDLVLTFCPKMHFTQQRRLKLLNFFSVQNVYFIYYSMRSLCEQKWIFNDTEAKNCLKCAY